MAVNVVEAETRMGMDYKPSWTITDKDKTQAEFIVRKSRNGFSFFEVALSNGPTPAGLDGQFTKATHAIEAVTKYLHNMKVTQATKNVETHKRIEEKKLAKAEEKS